MSRSASLEFEVSEPDAESVGEGRRGPGRCGQGTQRRRIGATRRGLVSGPNAVRQCNGPRGPCPLHRRPNGGAAARLMWEGDVGGRGPQTGRLGGYGARHLSFRPRGQIPGDAVAETGGRAWAGAQKLRRAHGDGWTSRSPSCPLRSPASWAVASVTFSSLSRSPLPLPRRRPSPHQRVANRRLRRLPGLMSRGRA